MAPYNAPARSHGIGVFSILFGLLGLATCWWTPAGMILSLAGLVLGLVGCVMARRGRWASSAAGLILSAAALAVCWVVAAWGMEFIRLHALR